MKITNMTYEIFRRAAHRWALDNDVSLERVEHYGRDEILELAINWSSLGAQPIQMARSMAAYLNAAAAIAEEVNRYQFEVVPGNDPDINSIESWTAETAKVYKMLKAGQAGKLGRWFEDRRIA